MQEIGIATAQQRKFIVEEMILTKWLTATRRKFKRINNFSSAKKTIQQLIIKLQNEYTRRNLNKGRSGHPVTQCNSETMNHLQSIMIETDTKSIRKLASETGVSRTTVQKIIKKDLDIKSYSAKVTEQLSAADHTKRLQFCQGMKMMMENENINFNEILFSDESNIHLNGSPNKQNCREWSTSKPSFNFSVPLHSPNITAWCGMSSKNIYGPFLFEDSETGEATTITTERYLRMLQVIFDDDNIDEWFQ